MPDDKKNVRMVPESDVIAIKSILRDKEKKWNDERLQFNQKISRLENEVKIVKANTEDDEAVQIVKEDLMKQADELKQTRAKLDEDLNSYSKREREFRAGEIAADLKSKGLEITADDLLSEEDMDRKAKDVLVDFQAKEIERLKASPQHTPESVFESGNGGSLKKLPSEMTDDEFNAHWQNMSRQASLKK